MPIKLIRTKILIFLMVIYLYARSDQHRSSKVMNNFFFLSYTTTWIAAFYSIFLKTGKDHCTQINQSLSMVSQTYPVLYCNRGNGQLSIDTRSVKHLNCIEKTIFFQPKSRKSGKKYTFLVELDQKIYHTVSLTFLFTFLNNKNTYI